MSEDPRCTRDCECPVPEHNFHETPLPVDQRGWRVLVCGDRNWTDRTTLERELDLLVANRPVRFIIEGEARGADTMAREWAEKRGVPVQRCPADWNRYGRAAGPIRNREMLVRYRPDLVVAFHPDIAASRGTADMVRRAQGAGVPVYLVAGPRSEVR